MRTQPHIESHIARRLPTARVADLARQSDWRELADFGGFVRAIPFAASAPQSGSRCFYHRDNTIPRSEQLATTGLSEAFRQGVSGWVDDGLCFTQPWGFDVAEIRIPTRVNYGLTDVFVPWQHGEWLAHNIPNAEAVIEEDGGHLHGPDVIAAAYAWLVKPD